MTEPAMTEPAVARPAHPSHPPDPAAAADGRTARALRTANAIVDACIALVEEGDVSPSAARVAERAGVSVRSVFQHFADLETLYGAVTARLVDRFAHLVSPVPVDLDLPTRIERFCAQRAALFEVVTPYRRAADVHVPRSPTIRAEVRRAHRYLRAEIETVFEPELAALDGPDRDRVRDALDLACSWAAWDHLRHRAGLDAAAAAAAVRLAVERILEPSRTGG